MVGFGSKENGDQEVGEDMITKMDQMRTRENMAENMGANTEVNMAESMVENTVVKKKRPRWNNMKIKND